MLIPTAVRRSHLLFFLFSQLLVSTLANVWPSSNPAYDDMEDVYTITGGNGDSGFTATLSSCDVATFELAFTGRQEGAEWIRTAFHDMSTYNDGVGGLDASLQFELDRPENVGSGFSDTFGILSNNGGGHRTMSDLLAMAVVIVTKICMGPSVPFRAGRIDATQGGGTGVPEPQQDIATHTADFKRMGFTAAEMITLVACGHTFGGVHEVDFPTIVPASEVSPTNTDGVQKFAKSSTYDFFDNHIAVEWIDGTTTNPLVTSFNETMHSDSRIFVSDGNVTMKALADSREYFNSQCSALFARMIDTVPREVQLTQPITPYPVKPFGMLLYLMNETALRLEGNIRLFDEDPSTYTNETTITASIIWKDRKSGSCPANECSAPANYDSTKPSTSLFGSVALVEVNATVDAQQGLSSYTVDYAVSGGSVTHAANGGGGFPLQDFVVWHKTASCAGLTSGQATLVIGIRNDSGEVTSPQVLWQYHADSGNINGYITVEAELVLSTSLVSPSSLYTLYSSTVDSNRIASFTASADVRGKTYTLFVDGIVVTYPTC